MNFVKRGKTECPKCKAIKEKIIENCFVEAYKILCSDRGDIVEKFINRMNNIITENSSDKLIENIEAEKQKLNSKMNKLIDLSLDNAIDRDTFLERKEKLQTQIEQLNMKQEKFMLDERNNANRKLSLNKIRKFLETGDIVTEFDKDAFGILIKQVIVGGYDEKENADPHAITFVLKNDNIINYKEYLQTCYNVGKLNLQESNHTRGVLCSDDIKRQPIMVKFIKSGKRVLKVKLNNIAIHQMTLLTEDNRIKKMENIVDDKKLYLG